MRLFPPRYNFPSGTWQALFSANAKTNMADEGSIHSTTSSKDSTVLQTLKEDGKFTELP